MEPGLKLWGSERAFLATLPALSAASEELFVLTPPGSELVGAVPRGLATVETAPIGNLHRSGWSARLRAAASIARSCRKHRIERIYLNQAGMCRLVQAVARLMRLPSVIHVRLRDDVARCAALTATAAAPIELVFVSKDMLERYPRAREPHKRAHLAYDPFELTPVAAPVAHGNRLFACVGRIDENKGQLDLIEAVAQARRDGADITLDVIGAAAAGNPCEARAGALVRSLRLEGAVELLGYLPDAATRMAAYKYIVVPSRYEALGRVVLEAWDAGAVPICSKDSGGAAEIVAASAGGLLYEGHAPESIAGTLRMAAALPEAERARLVSSGRAWASEHLSLATYQKALSGVLFSARTRLDEPAFAADSRLPPRGAT